MKAESPERPHSAWDSILGRKLGLASPLVSAGLVGVVVVVGGVLGRQHTFLVLFSQMELLAIKVIYPNNQA